LICDKQRDARGTLADWAIAVETLQVPTFQIGGNVTVRPAVVSPYNGHQRFRWLFRYTWHSYVLIANFALAARLCISYDIGRQLAATVHIIEQ